MKQFLAVIMLLAAIPAFAEENVVYDDGVGAQISFCLPIQETDNGQEVQYSSFKISVEKGGKFLLLADLAGAKSKDGSNFVGKLIIPSELVASAEITIFGSPLKSSRAVQKTFRVSSFKKITRAKSWTEEK